MRSFDKYFEIFCFDVDLYVNFDFFENVIKKKYISLNIVVVIDHDVNKSMLINNNKKNDDKKNDDKKNVDKKNKHNEIIKISRTRFNDFQN